MSAPQKSRSAIHMCWALVALGAFGAGYFTRSAPGVHSRAAATEYRPTGTAAIGDPGRHSTSTAGLTGGSNSADQPGLSAIAERSPANMVARVGQVWRLGSDLERQRQFLEVLDDMQAADAPHIFKTLHDLSEQGIAYKGLWTQFWTRWGQLDGPSAIQTLQSTPNGWGDVGQITWGWGETRPEEAAKWLEEHQDLADFGTALLGLTHGYASKDLNGSTSMVLRATSPGDPLVGKLMEALAVQAVRQGTVSGLLTWFDTLPADADLAHARAAALRYVYTELRHADVEHVKVWVQKQSTSPWRDDGVIDNLAGKLAQSNPSSALDWLQSLPPSAKDGTYPGLDKVIATWSKADPAAVQGWVQNAAPGAFKTQAGAALDRLQKRVQ